MMLDRAREIYDRLVAWRRDFHMHPELGFEETRTAARVARELEALGYRVRTGVGRTGVVAERGQGAPVVAIRADMDALPIEEANEVDYASRVPGVMHACGHDAHTAMLLGVAALLADEAFPGTLRLLFQPAEEIGDEEGLSGAPRMVQDGAMEGVDVCLAQHVDASMAVGDVMLGAGPASAGVDSFFVTIHGQGGHGAFPHLTVDPIYLAAHAVLALHGIVSRRLDPTAPAVVSIGSLHGGEAPNVIPAQVELCGTIRFMEPGVQKQIHAEIERALGVVRALGGDFELQFEIGCLPLINDAGVVQVLQDVCADLLGAEHIEEGEPEMGAEDFGTFADLAPGAMFCLGCRIEGDVRWGHSPRFDIDERCLPIGTAVLAEAALRLLHKMQDPQKNNFSVGSDRSATG
ncbi:MAG: amidohydrolase [Chloroflexia bacterium]|nr:amidohydrolase [Chloroflexia bacterium]